MWHPSGSQGKNIYSFPRKSSGFLEAGEGPLLSQFNILISVKFIANFLITSAQWDSRSYKKPKDSSTGDVGGTKAVCDPLLKNNSSK